jgi:hypothetical protein
VVTVLQVANSADVFFGIRNADATVLSRPI